MSINEIKAKKIFAGPGTWAWIAEAIVEDNQGNDLFVTVHYYDGENYSVSKQSVYAFLADDGDEPASELLEEYDDYKDAKKSVYAKVFDALRKVIDKLG